MYQKAWSFVNWKNEKNWPSIYLILLKTKALPEKKHSHLKYEKIGVLIHMSYASVTDYNNCFKTS